MKKLQHGFTLIELVIVVTIIAILAAIALPRYVAMQADARLAKMEAIRGALNSAAALARARCELDLVATPVGTCTNVGGTVNMDGQNIAMVNRYPQALTNAAGVGILMAAGLGQIGGTIATAGADGVFATGGGAAGGSVLTITPVGATNPANCTVTYTSPAAAGGAPTILLNPNASTTNC